MAAPCVVVSVCNGFAALDATLAALSRHLPEGAVVHLADDASSDPRIGLLIADWRRRTRHEVRHRRAESPLGSAASANLAFRENGDADVLWVRPGVEPQGDALSRLLAAASALPGAATVSAWSHAAEFASFPAFVSPNPRPDDPERLARAIARRPPTYPRLPSPDAACCWIRRASLRAVGDLDASSFPAFSAALLDWSLRAEAHGAMHALADDAYVAQIDDPALAGFGDDAPARLDARWPGHRERIARFILDDPLREARARFHEALAMLDAESPQGDLFR